MQETGDVTLAEHPARPWARHLAWLPIPLIALAAAALYGFDSGVAHESAVLLVTLSGIFRTSTSLLIAYLAARTYLVAGSRPVLALGCGALTFGLASFLVGLLVVDTNAALTVYNSGLCLAGACFVVSAVWALRARRAASPAPAPRVAALSYLAVSLAMGLVLWGALAHALPRFFTAQGFTALRQGTLGLTVVEFALASLCSILLYARSRTPFVKRYGIGLALIGLGVLVIIVEGSPGTALSWAGRLGQFLGGLYMLAGVVTVTEGRWDWAIPLEHALYESERRPSLIFDKAVSAMALARPDGTLLEVNEQWVRTFGYTKAEARGKTSAQLGIDRELQAWQGLRDRALRQGSVYGAEATLYTRDGERRIFLSNLDLVELDGEPYLLSSLQDISERKQAEAERERLLAAERQARGDAEAVLRARDEFLAVAAHELKTPLTTLRGFPQLLLRRLEAGPIADDQLRAALRAIDRQATRLAGLVSQLVDVSAVQDGQLPLEFETVDLVPLLREVVDAAQLSARELSVRLEAPPCLAATVDPLRIQQVLANLIDNALKFGPRGGLVEVELAGCGPDGVRLSVRDHGPGIAPAERERVFARYHRAGIRRPAGGLGLGLYISERIVERHQGRIWAEFPPDGGSRFVVTLPVGPPAAVPPASAPPPVP